MNRSVVFCSIAFSCVAAVFAAACGDPLVDADYHGEALLRLQGEVRLVAQGSPGRGRGMGEAAAPAPPQGPLRLALLWADFAGRAAGHGVATVEQQAVTTAEFPARYTATLYTPPEEALVAPVPDGAGRYALGLLVVYVDADGDGRWSAAVDALVGGSLGRVVVFTPAGTTGAWPGALGPGYHVLRRAGAGGSCSPGAWLPLAHAEGDVDVEVAQALPLDVLLDLDCDGESKEWGKACPQPAHLAVMCDRMPADGWPCGACPR